MKAAKLLVYVIALALLLTARPAPAQVLRGAALEQRVNALLARMTLAEKLGQLQILDGEANGKYRPDR